ncbi:MAG: ribosome maturation factor RimM [Nitrospinaceae bacterium]
MTSEWISVGKITKTHGLKGELKVRFRISDSGLLSQIHRLRLMGENGPGTELEVEFFRGDPSRLIIKFKELNSIDEAKAFSGHTLYARREDFHELPEGEYYWFQIEGLKVYDEAGQYYGCVHEIIATGSNDVYVVRDGEKEILLPMIEPVVKTIDLQEKKLIFHKLDGLIEDTPV